MSDRDIESSPVRGRADSREAFRAFQPDPASVDQLLAAAHAHPLGIDYLMKGYLGSVAASFGVHAFTVEEARKKASLDTRQPKGDRDGLS